MILSQLVTACSSNVNRLGSNSVTYLQYVTSRIMNSIHFYLIPLIFIATYVGQKHTRIYSEYDSADVRRYNATFVLWVNAFKKNFKSYRKKASNNEWKRAYIKLVFSSFKNISLITYNLKSIVFAKLHIYTEISANVLSHNFVTLVTNFSKCFFSVHLGKIKFKLLTSWLDEVLAL